MKHSDFYIGKEFFTGSGKWRCTDVGTRVIVAISLEPRNMVRSWREGSDWREERFLSHDPGDLIGPPFAVAEHVFGEYDIEGCYESADEAPEDVQSQDIQRGK